MEIVEGKYRGEFIASEANGSRSREKVTVDTGNLQAGTVLGKITATGKFVQMDPAAVDGSEVAAGILYDNVDATAADMEAVIIARDAEVNANDLVWPAGILAADQAAAIAELADLGIIVRS